MTRIVAADGEDRFDAYERAFHVACAEGQPVELVNTRGEFLNVVEPYYHTCCGEVDCRCDGMDELDDAGELL